MSELTYIASKPSLRHSLLLTVSAATLLSLVYTQTAIAEEDADRPTVWIELGGQLDRVGGQVQPYVPHFIALGEQHGLLPIADLQKSPHYGVGEHGSVSFQPEGSSWSFKASIQYGRSSSSKYRHKETPVSMYINPDLTVHLNGPNAFSYLNQTADYNVRSSESHTVLDFSVGKDVGLGLWKDKLESQIAFGVRFAQFSQRTTMDLRGDPDPHFGGTKYFPPIQTSIPATQFYQFYKAKPELSRSFRGWGPSLSWNGSVPMIESTGEDAEVLFDFGANFGILFGRQNAAVHHHTSGELHSKHPLGPLTGRPKYTVTHYYNTANPVRSRTVIVPNVGGLAGISLKLPNAKMSIGYKVDFFFGAMDGGIDARKTSDRGFYGPFATISVGLGG